MVEIFLWMQRRLTLNINIVLTQPVTLTHIRWGHRNYNGFCILLMMLFSHWGITNVTMMTCFPYSFIGLHRTIWLTHSTCVTLNMKQLGTTHSYNYLNPFKIRKPTRNMRLIRNINEWFVNIMQSKTMVNFKAFIQVILAPTKSTPHVWTIFKLRPCFTDWLWSMNWITQNHVYWNSDT